jgi:bifunctional UDP-N-acetylglucosamine pyrophosphorylase/glucosamine-1-phosphate N-acetyltransferase
MPILHEKISTIILAAGVGKRMQSNTPKILHPILGKPIISFVLDLARDIDSDQIVLIVSDPSYEKSSALGSDICFAVQEKPLGSGDAALKGLNVAHHENVCILCGDVPLLRKETLVAMLDYHRKKDADLTVLTCEVKKPYGYGRIIRGLGEQITAIIEQIDATPEQQNIKEINSGAYVAHRDLLVSALKQITNRNEQGEFYLTDAVRNITAAGRKVCGHMTGDENEIIGINTKAQLAQVRTLVKQTWFETLMSRGVYIEDPATTSIDLSVEIGDSVHIRPHTLIEGKTKINDDETVGPFVWIRDGKRMAAFRE